MKNNIYVVLVKAHTGLGKFVRLFTKYDYTHIAVCLNDKLDDFITFSRRKHYAPFDCGFMHETLDCYAFGKHKDVKLKVFAIPVSEDNLNNIKDYIKEIEKDNEYIFNFLSMITMPIIHGFKISKSHNCMSFVTKIIELTKTIKLTKKYYKYNIKEIDYLLKDYLYKEDIFIKEQEENKTYMERVSILKNISLFFTLISKLIIRIIKRNEQHD